MVGKKVYGKKLYESCEKENILLLKEDFLFLKGSFFVVVCFKCGYLSICVFIDFDVVDKE